MNIIEALGLSFLGLVIVFAVLLLLMLVIFILSTTVGRKYASPATQATANDTPAPAAKTAYAPGSAGEICMFDVPDKDAAMIMAIVADKLDAPLNELRFLSIKEVTDHEI